MNTVPRLLHWIAIAAVSSLFALQANAQATRTWVSGVGDDANPCSRTAPCKTFAGAISKTASGGEIDALDPAGYGAVTITKSITINGNGTIASVLVSGTNGIVVSAGASDVVTLRNIDVVGLGTGLDGIRFLAGAQLNLERVNVNGFTGNGLSFLPNSPGRLVVEDSIFRNNSGSGIHVAPSGGASAIVTLKNTTLNTNGRGMRAEDGAKVAVQNSVATGNGGNGFIANGVSRSVDMVLEATGSFQNGGAGVFAGPLSTVRISRINVSGNSTGLLPSGGGAIVSTGTNAVWGNTSDGAPTSGGGQM